MGEKRKPTRVILLKKSGNKTSKIELFPMSLFEPDTVKDHCCTYKGRYRIRVNGVWHKAETPRDWGDETYIKKYFTIYEIRDLLWRSWF